MSTKSTANEIADPESCEVDFAANKGKGGGERDRQMEECVLSTVVWKGDGVLLALHLIILHHSSSDLRDVSLPCDTL
jgi:hypothetical protein